MPIKRPQLVNDEIYHIVNRGTGDSLIFNDINDYYRGIFSIYEFNTSNLVTIRERRKIRLENKKINRDRTPVPDNRNFLVEIMAFCFMPNHIHLLLKQLKDDGISQFMQKFGAGYAGYFNIKNNRKGPLFGKFRAVHIADDMQLKNAAVYIFTNPLSLIESGWKENGIENPEKAIKFLEKFYKWSSYKDCIGIKNFPSVIVRDFLLEVMGGPEGCHESVNNWIRYKKRNLGSVMLE